MTIHVSRHTCNDSGSILTSNLTTVYGIVKISSYRTGEEEGEREEKKERGRETEN